MITGFLNHILPRKPVSRMAVLAWSAFFLLFPLAFVAGSFLAQQDLRRSLSGVFVDRGSAIATARQFVTERGIDVTSWSAYVSIEPSPSLMRYYRDRRSATSTAAQSFSLSTPVRVLLISGSDEMASVTLDNKGQVVGFDLTQVNAAGFSGRDTRLPPDQATAIAAAAVSKIPNLSNLLALGKPEIATQNRGATRCQKFTWHTASPQLPGLTFEINASVCGAEALARSVDTTLDKDYSKANSLTPPRSLTALLSVYVIYVVVVFIYSFYRYARRAFEREVSHIRTLLLGSAIALAFLLNFLTGLDEYVLANYNAGQTIQWFPIIGVAVTFMVMGLMIALAYEAGEGDLRELYPGKLTSFDAVLRGKLFSRNVARSALFGTAFAGWMLLLQGLMLWALHPEVGNFAANLLKLPFFRFPLVAIFVSQAISVTLIPATGLLLPLGFLHRNVRRVHVRNVLLLVFVLLASLIHAAEWGSLGIALIGTAILAASLLGPFLALDFLAVTFGLMGWQVANALARLVGISSSWIPLSVGVGLVALLFVIVEAWASLRGREYRMDEVRPLYASTMAERQLLEAEIAAAREAQLHLLPKNAPNIDGLTISAECIPARVVGGDFYDFFPLANNRLGIFIAEGGNRGIGSALSIALAKGFLMHTVQRNLAPHEVIIRLESALGNLLESAGATTTVAYAVVDTGMGEIRYARTGEYPKVVVASRPAKEIRMDIPGSNKAIYAATLQLRGGDAILLFTDGIARRVRLSASDSAEEMLRALKRRRSAAELEDDLTAVVVRVLRTGAAMEVVA